jgi:hypothetical protein
MPVHPSNLYHAALLLLQVRIRTSQEMAAVDDNERISLARGAYL